MDKRDKVIGGTLVPWELQYTLKVCKDSLRDLYFVKSCKVLLGEKQASIVPVLRLLRH
ncbi:hypothetical protein SAMN05216583_10865 [Selenomonas sp. KH1T6]|nr:hypothetical protein SAMN05216583_10865 [Selenomonas ruminantium]